MAALGPLLVVASPAGGDGVDATTVVAVGKGSALALLFLVRRVPFCCLQAQDARHHGRYGPEGTFRHVCWYLTMSLALCSSWLSQAQDARHHVRHGPQDSYVEVHRCSSWTRSLLCPLVCYEWRHGPDSAENCLAIPQVQLLDEVVVPVVCNDNALVLMLRTLEVPQLQFLDKVFHRCSSWTRFSCPLCATTGPRVPDSSETRGGPAGAAHHHGHLHPRRGAEFVPYGSDFSADHRDTTVQFLDKEMTCPLVSHTGAQVQTCRIRLTPPLLCHTGALVQHRRKQWRFRCCSSLTWMRTCPSWCNDRCWSRRAENCGVPQLQCIDQFMAKPVKIPRCSSWKRLCSCAQPVETPQAQFLVR